jgi:C-5 cytosine-specific DNA methylase
VRPLRMLDLCAGMGGASKAMRARSWEVVAIDVDSRARPDVAADVRALPLRAAHWDLIWVSPPCTDFSRFGMGLPAVVARRVEPDLSIALHVRQLIEELKPTWWIVENVWASRPFLIPIFGPVQASVPGHCFWGRLPGLIPWTAPHKHRSGRAGMPSWRRSLYRARIPYEISIAVALAIENRCSSQLV